MAESRNGGAGKRCHHTLAALVLAVPLTVCAGLADVVDASVRCDAARTCTFTATVRHADSGWDHYANAWRILAPDGTVLATRTLFHPHVNEQPFTRSLSGVRIPAAVNEVQIEALDSTHGDGGRRFSLSIP